MTASPQTVEAAQTALAGHAIAFRTPSHALCQCAQWAWTGKDRDCHAAHRDHLAQIAADALQPTIAAEALRDAAKALPGMDSIRTHGDAARWATRAGRQHRDTERDLMATVDLTPDEVNVTLTGLYERLDETKRYVRTSGEIIKAHEGHEECCKRGAVEYQREVLAAFEQRQTAIESAIAKLEPIEKGDPTSERR